MGCLVNLKELWMDNNGLRELPPVSKGELLINNNYYYLVHRLKEQERLACIVLL